MTSMKMNNFFNKIRIFELRRFEFEISVANLL